MREANGGDAEPPALVEVLGDDGHDVARREGMEIELSGDGKGDGLSVVREIAALLVAGQRLTRTSKDPALSTK